VAPLAWFLIGTLGGLVSYHLVRVLSHGGTVRRVLLASTLLLILGWITLYPQVSTAPAPALYRTVALIGTVLLAGSVAVRSVVSRRIRQISGPDPADVHLGITGSACLFSGLAGFVLGEEVLTLLYGVTAVVTVIVLYLFR